MEWADLPIVDFSKVGTPEGRAELVPQVRDAMRTHGFLIVVNHGWTQAQVRNVTTCPAYATDVRILLSPTEPARL